MAKLRSKIDRLYTLMSCFSARVEKIVYIRVRVSFGVTWLGSCTVLSGNVDFLVERPRPIYTTKIGTFGCPPHISETVAVRLLKLAHRSRIASTTKEIISKQMLLSILSIFFKTI